MRAVAALCVLAVLGCGPRSAPSPAERTAHPGAALVPGPSEWIDVGLVLDTGGFGSWDTIMEGTTPSAIVRRDATWLLYYVGARDYITRTENIGPAGRSIGVATSTDAIRWTKPSGAPVITHSVSGNPEEGAVSAGLTLAADGSLLAFYGANTSADSTTNEVRADVRRAVSHDGLHFEPSELLIEHDDPRVWGHGDEIHATLALSHAGRVHVFYVPNGSSQSGRLGWCRFTEDGEFEASGPVLSGGAPVQARGPVSAVQSAPGRLVVFVSNRGILSAHAVAAEDPRDFGPAIASYEIGTNAIVALDAERRTWLLFYDRWTHIGLRVAPAGAPDLTPPSPPTDLRAQALAHDRVALRWSAAADSQTGVLLYHVYRDGERIGRAFELATTDSTCGGARTHVYEVRAMNLHGVEGPPARAAVTTPDAPRSAPPPDPAGPVAHWTMDDVSDLGADSSGWSHHAALVGELETPPDPREGALVLDGSAHLECAPAPILTRTFAGSFTLLATVRPSEVPPRGDASEGAFAIFTGPDGVRLVYRADRRFVASIGGGEAALELASETFEPRAWHELAMVVDDSARTLALYVDGTAVPGSPVNWEQTRPRLRFESQSHARYRGRCRIGVASPLFALGRHAFRGAIDEVILYGRALSDAELQAPR